MYRASVLYGMPEDTEAFDSYYADVHIPIARRMKGLVRWTVTKVDQVDGPLKDVYLIADLYAESKSALDAIFDSPEGRAASADVQKFATGGVSFVFGEEEEVSLR